jgi:hypothetical protein
MCRMVYRLALILYGLASFTFPISTGHAAIPESLTKATHKQVRVLRPTYEGRELRLNTFAVAPDGELWMCCSLTPNSDVDSEASKAAIADLDAKLAVGKSSESQSTESEANTARQVGRLLIYKADGTFIRSVPLGFEPQAINFADSGIPFVAGSGKVARLTKAGELDLAVLSPNLQSDEETEKLVEKRKKSMIESMLRSQENSVNRIQLQIAELEAQIKKDQKNSKADARLLERNEKRLEVLLKSLEAQEERLKTLEEDTLSKYAKAMDTSRLVRTSGLAISPTDVFVSLSSLEGSGYDIYRLSHELTDAEVVKKRVSGCCGQLDIQCDGTNLVIAENTNFKVASYDRDGKPVSKFGDNARNAKDDEERVTGWGSCCNPMNVRCLSNGDVLVAESSIGHVKRYTADGKFLGLIGTAKIAGGCKHVAVAKAVDQDWYFMMNTTANNISVLVPQSEAPEETDDEREARLAMQGLGQKLLGSWKFERRTDKDEKEVAAKDAAEADTFDYGEYLINRNKFMQLNGDGKVSRLETKPVVEKPVAKKASSGGFFGFIGSLFGSKQAKVTSTSEDNERSRWEAIKQEQDVVQFAVFDSEVKSLVASVRFIDDQKAEFKLYHDEAVGEPMAVATYLKVAGCSEESCAAGNCEKPTDDKTKSSEKKVSDK